MRKIKNITRFPIYILDEDDVIHEFLPEEYSIEDTQIYETGKKKVVTGKSINITVKIERNIDPRKSNYIFTGVEDLPEKEDPNFLFIIEPLSFSILEEENSRRKDVATILKKNTFIRSYQKEEGNIKDVAVTRILTLL